MTSSCLLANCPAVDGINISRPRGEQSETLAYELRQHLAVATFAVSDQTRKSGMRPSMLGFPQEADIATVLALVGFGSKTRTSSLGAARPLPPSADIGPGGT